MTGEKHDSINREPGSTSFRARLTLGLAVAGSLLLIGGTVLYLRDGQAGSEPAASLPGPWEPPSGAPPSDAESGGVPPGSEAVPIPTVTPPAGGDDTEQPPPPAATRTTAAPPPPTTTRPPATTNPPGPNLSLDADADSDGSSKAEGTSFGNVQDGSLATFWSPKGTTTGDISIKWGTAVTLSRVNIREASGGGAIRSWELHNYDTGALLASGSGAGVITFRATTLKKITFEILSAAGTPRVAEFETFF